MVYYPQIKPERGITMKKLALVFAAALALTACTAAPTETATVPAAADPPAEAAATEENADAEQFPVGELRLCDDWRRDTDTAYYTLYGDVDTTELTGLKLDYADGVQTKIMSLDIADTPHSDFLVTNDNVVRMFLSNADGSEFRFKTFYPDGRSEERTASQEITPMVYDEYAAYVLRDNCVARLDWQTGEVTTWDTSIPQIDEILGAVGNKILLTRIVSDMPLPTDPEMYEAVIQNSQREFDLYDIATNTLEKLFAEPRYPEDGGSWKIYRGCRGDMLYFAQRKSDGDGYKEALLGYDLTTGTMQELYAEASSDWVGGTGSPKSFSRGGQLELVFLQSTPDALHIYNAADGQVYNVPYHDPALNAAYGTGENYGCPIAVTGDGRVLVTDGYCQRNGHTVDAYGLIDLDDYLAGRTDYTPVQMWAQ